MLVVAIVLITGALVFYSIGVWGEKLSGGLAPRWLVLFWLGFVCDTAGTTAMSIMSSGTFTLNFHGITGLIAIVLMALHAIWATVVLVRSDEKVKKSFHRLSVVVWTLWLLPYLSGVIVGMGAT